MLFLFAGRHAIGWGAYFAVSAQHSHNYTKPTLVTNMRYMILVSVVTGEYCVGHKDMKTLPYLLGTPFQQYDSAADQLANPQIFVTFSDASAYPQYVIEYT